MKRLIQIADWWLLVETVVHVIKPIVSMLRFVDTQKQGISKLYLRAAMLQTWVKAMDGEE